jgi:hypothetical protein
MSRVSWICIKTWSKIYCWGGYILYLQFIFGHLWLHGILMHMFNADFLLWGFANDPSWLFISFLQDELSLTDVVVWGTLYPLLVQQSHQKGSQLAFLTKAKFAIFWVLFWKRREKSKGPVTLLRMRETCDKRMKINEIIFIRTKILWNASVYEYRTSGVPLAYSACA